MNRFEWSIEARNGIDAYDAAVIMGANKNLNILDVYNSKIGKEKSIGINKDILYFEIKLEELVAKEFSLRTGKKIRKDSRSICHDEHKFMLTNIDRKVIGENAILDCRVIKNQDYNYFEKEMMESVYIEAQHNMKVKNAEIYYIAALINSEKFILRKINRDDVLISKIIEAEKNFWVNHVENKIKPEI